MAMSLTKTDLQAIKQLVDGSIDDRVPAIIDEHVPTIIDERVPVIINGHVPTIIDEHVPAIIDERVSTIIDDRVPRIIDEHVPGIINEHVPAIIDERVPAIIHAHVQPMFDKFEKRFNCKIEELTLAVGKFSRETTDNFDRLNGRVDDLSEKLATVADMTDYNRVEIRKIKRKLGLI